MPKNRWRKCCVSNCSSDKNISYHYFPKKRALADIWKINCAITRPLKKTDAVCERHFQLACFKSHEKKIKRLKADAVPTIGLDHTAGTGFPSKDAYISKLKNIPYLHSDDKKGEITENIDFKNLNVSLSLTLSVFYATSL